MLNQYKVGIYLGQNRPWPGLQGSVRKLNVGLLHRVAIELLLAELGNNLVLRAGAISGVLQDTKQEQDISLQFCERHSSSCDLSCILALE